MKRKHSSHKKNKHNKNSRVSADDNNEDHDSENTESSEDTEDEAQPLIHTENKPSASASGQSLSQARVKVKLKSSKKLESSDAPQSDTDNKSSSKQDDAKGGLELLSQVPVMGYSSNKSASIKIKSSKGIATLAATPVMQTGGDRITEPKIVVGIVPHKVSYQAPQKNEEELTTSLGVIRKIMKMDAAEPFNTPVDPIALGIPDYLDIIDTPMDFGTICSNLELGHPYKNSEDVYNDVQYIWENCYKYNNKGDYIVDLMKRVKKNFMKYWTAAGLYSNQPNKNIASEGLPVGIMAPSQEKVHVKGTGSKYKKKGGRHGFHKHKSDCMCAICGVRRRSNAKLVETQIEISDGNVSQEFKQEEPYTENHYSEDASSNLDRSDADVDMADQNEETPEKIVNPRDEIKEEVIEIQKRRENQQFQVDDGSGKSEMEESPVTSQTQNSKHDTPPRNEDEDLEILKSQLKHDSLIMKQQNMMCKNLVIDENPVIMKLCGTLFSTDPKSIWSGPHSLVRRNLPVRKKSYGIQSALGTLMK